MTATSSRGAQAVDVALRDGSSVHIRPVDPGDGPLIRAFLEALSIESIGFRFFGSPNLDWVTRWSVDVDYADRYGLVATVGAHNEIVGHSAYARIDNERAEVAFVVADGWQQHGIATIMLAHLAAVAEQHGISVFTAEVLPANHHMISVFRDSGFSVDQHARDGVIEIDLPTSLSPEAQRRFEEREQTAAIAAVRRFLCPRSVAVVGASHRQRTVGGAIFRNIMRAGFTGTVYPVNRRARTVQGHAAYSSIRDVPESVDLAVIVVPAAEVAAVARQCGSAGVRALLVISAGFAEAGPAGARRQSELLGICRATGMRMIGPNCLGVFNTGPDAQLDATFAARIPPPGRVAFLSQSGGLGIAVLEAASRLGLGFSSFVSVGNKADVSGNDLLEYWEHDSATEVVLLYLESFGNPRRFARIARRVSRAKPIVAVKSGRSPAGVRATSSHTGALISASDATVDALFRQAGVIRTDTMHELFDVAALLSSQPLPRRGRVAIVTNAGGPAILCADACQAKGLDVVKLPPKVRRRLAGFLAREASLVNPIDMIATAPAGDYRRTIEVLIEEQACDAIVAIFVPALVTAAEDAAREIHAAAQNAGGVTLASVFLSGDAIAAVTAPGRVGVPMFEFPEDAAGALAHAAQYARWRSEPGGSVRAPTGCRPDEAAAIVTCALSAGTDWLAPHDVAALLACYGLPLIATHVVRSRAQAVATATALGYPVALKAIAPGLVHKSDAGGVRLGLRNAAEVRRAAIEIRAAVATSGHELDGLIVQPMAADGVELLAGVVYDESFGPVIACGAGGTSAELLKDVAVRITPLSDVDAMEMLRSLRTFPLLEGYRGAVACDTAAVADVLIRLSAMVEAHPEIAEMDANPLVARADGALIIDARVRIQAPPARLPLSSLRA